MGIFFDASEKLLGSAGAVSIDNAAFYATLVRCVETGGNRFHLAGRRIDAHAAVDGAELEADGRLQLSIAFQA